MKKISRRKFIFFSIAAIGGTAVASLTYVTLFRNEKLIFSILAADLEELKINERDIASYASDAVRLNPFNFTPSKWKFVSLYSRLGSLRNFLPWVPKYVQFRAEIVGNFLLSTGYFRNKMDPNEPIQYTGRVYTPYNYPCGNPFSNLFYPGD